MSHTMHLWAILAALYIGTGMYYKSRWGREVSDWATGSMFAIGFAIFIVVARGVGFAPADWVELLSYLIISVMFAAWLMATFALHTVVVYIQTQRQNQHDAN